MSTLVKGADEVRQFYGDRRVSDKYIARRFTTPLGSVLHHAQVSFVNDAIRRCVARRVLEVAPGPGRLTTHIDLIDRGVAVEFNANMLALARRRLSDAGRLRRWTLCRGDAFRLPVGPGFDLAYTFRFIRHFELPDRQRLYAQFHRALNPGGLFVFDAVNYRTSYSVGHRHGSLGHGVYDVLYRRPELKSELADAGFRVVELRSVYAHYLLQYWSQIFIAPRWAGLARRLIQWLEDPCARQPLEWIVLCCRE